MCYCIVQCASNGIVGLYPNSVELVSNASHLHTSYSVRIYYTILCHHPYQENISSLQFEKKIVVCKRRVLQANGRDGNNDQKYHHHHQCTMPKLKWGGGHSSLLPYREKYHFNFLICWVLLQNPFVNIARGTKDPGYWLRNSNNLYSLFSSRLQR